MGYDNGHQEFSIGIDKNGYIHITGDMHNFPYAEECNIPPEYTSSIGSKRDIILQIQVFPKTS